MTNGNVTKPTLLITGASGLLGHALVEAAEPAWRVVGTWHRHKPHHPIGRWIRMDLADGSVLPELIEAVRPAAVIHAAAIAQPGRCRQDPDETEVVNVNVPGDLAEICAVRAIPLVFTSTDLVFDGKNPPYNETASPRPLNVYGEQKARAEALVLARWPGALVCRLPLMIGVSPYGEDNFTFQMLTAIAGNRPVTLFEDEFRTPVDIWSAARGILQFIGRRSGLLHLGGRTRVSRLEIGLWAAEMLQVAPTMITSAAIRDLPKAASRAADCSMDSGQAFELGYDPVEVREAIRRAIGRLDGYGHFQ
jgi:dTDP-4-dehydrorhamnose reductase